MGIPVPLDVLLPHYDPTGKRGTTDPGPYPTLYLLHGSQQNSTSWLRNTGLERYIGNRPLAVVMPTGGNTFFANMVHMTRCFDFITEELPELCQRWFNLIDAPEKRAVAGLSMGGFAAMNAVLNRPDVFGWGASFSGLLDGEVLYTRGYCTDPRGIFGTREEFVQSSNNLFTAAQRLAASEGKKPELLVMIGEQDARLENNVRLAGHMKQLGLPVTFETSPGDHTWDFWDMCIRRALGWMEM